MLHLGVGKPHLGMGFASRCGRSVAAIRKLRGCLLVILSSCFKATVSPFEFFFFLAHFICGEDEVVR
jgi:hypothetical protein